MSTCGFSSRSAEPISIIGFIAAIDILGRDAFNENGVRSSQMARDALQVRLSLVIGKILAIAKNVCWNLNWACVFSCSCS